MSQPVPGIEDLALGFPLMLLLLTMFVPVTQAILTVTLFIALRTAATKLIVFEEIADEDPYDVVPLKTKEDDDDGSPSLSWQIDAVTLVLSIFSAGLLTSDTDNNHNYALRTIVPVVALAAVGAALLLWWNSVSAKVASEEQLSLQE